MIPLFKPYYSSQQEEKALNILRSGVIASGSYVSQFEIDFASLVKSENVITTDNMTSAIELALHISNVSFGDEVIISPFTCMATSAAIVNRGAKAVWIDLLPSSVFIDPNEIPKLITKKTKAILVYHVAGYPGYISEIASICKKYNLVLIEDCNNALLSLVDDCLVGGFGDFSIYSFYPNRQINGLEGGALVCKSKENAARARKLRRFGIDFDTFRLSNGEINPASNISEIGWAKTMSNLCCGVALTQIESVELRIKYARNNALIYDEAFSKIGHITPIRPVEGTIPSYWVYLLLVENRDEVLAILKDQGVQVSVLHQRNDFYSGFSSTALDADSNTALIQDKILALPCGWWLSSSEVDFIANVMVQTVNNLSK